MSNTPVALPPWEATELTALQGQGALSGIPAWGLAGIAENETGERSRAPA